MWYSEATQMHRPKKNTVKGSDHIRKSTGKCSLVVKSRTVMLKTAILFNHEIFLTHFYIIRPTWPMNIWPEQEEKLMMFQICSRLSSRVIYSFIQQMFTEHWLRTKHCVQCWDCSKEQVLKDLIRNTFPATHYSLFLSLRSLFVLFISSFSNLSFYFSLLWTLKSHEGREILSAPFTTIAHV